MREASVHRIQEEEEEQEIKEKFFFLFQILDLFGD